MDAWALDAHDTAHLLHRARAACRDWTERAWLLHGPTWSVNDYLLALHSEAGDAQAIAGVGALTMADWLRTLNAGELWD